MASVKKRPDGVWRARYRDAAGKEHARHFSRKVDGQRWLDEVTASVVTGTYTGPRTAKTTVGEWCATWLAGYAKRPSTVRAAGNHIARIRARFGAVPLAAVRPSDVRSWTADMHAEELADSYVHVVYKRFAQIMADAVYDGLIPRSPCSRRTSPRPGGQRPYVATTAQIWALHGAVPAALRPAVLLGAFAGLRTAESCGLRTADVDFLRAVIRPAVQWPEEPLKTAASRTAVPVARSLTLELSRCVAARKDVTQREHLLIGADGGQLHPKALERAMRTARAKVPGLPAGFRYHDLRHYFASLLIASGADVKEVQARLRHGSARTTLDTYGHLWPDRDESTRAAVEAVFAARAETHGVTAARGSGGEH